MKTKNVKKCKKTDVKNKYSKKNKRKYKRLTIYAKKQKNIRHMIKYIEK